MSTRLFKKIYHTRLMNEQISFLTMIQRSYSKYLQTTSRSNGKVNIIHKWIKNQLSSFYEESRYVLSTDTFIPACNARGSKNTDIVVFDKITNKYILGVCVKYVCSSYSKNRNNYLEGAIGEATTIKKANPGIKLISFNIFPSECPHYDKNGKIRRFESINYDNHLKIYESYVSDTFYDELIIYQLDIDYEKHKIIGLNRNTPYINFSKII